MAGDSCNPCGDTSASRHQRQGGPEREHNSSSWAGAKSLLRICCTPRVSFSRRPNSSILTLVVIKHVPQWLVQPRGGRMVQFLGRRPGISRGPHLKPLHRTCMFNMFSKMQDTSQKVVSNLVHGSCKIPYCFCTRDQIDCATMFEDRCENDHQPQCALTFLRLLRSRTGYLLHLLQFRQVPALVHEPVGLQESARSHRTKTCPRKTVCRALQKGSLQ